MNTQECKNTLLAKNQELKSRRFRREDIAIEKNVEPLDDIQQTNDRVLVLGSLARAWEMTSLISEALERIENRTYGLCVECEEQISEKRLAALPWARDYVRCQEATDRANVDARWADAA